VRAALLACALGALAGCANEHTIELELRPPRAPDGEPDVPPEVVTHEVRVYRADEGGCPDLASAAGAADFGALAHVQTFSASAGIGEDIGELPRGTWAIAALSRDASCAVLLYGCTSVAIGDEAPSRVVVDLAPSGDPTSRCGGCRACESGTCAPIDRICP
jgi:hypothetical protein